MVTIKNDIKFKSLHTKEYKDSNKFINNVS